jgi:RNA polymerase sigma-70 factor (ECF subfamily)
MISVGDQKTEKTDADLLAAICREDMIALQSLFDRYRQQLYQTALGITRDPHIAEEVLQDCFYRLYRYAGKLDGSSPLAPWLYRVTVNLCYSRLKKRRRQWAESFHQFAERLWASPRSAPDYVAEQHEMQAVVRETLERLSPAHRAVLVLHYFHDYSLTEIADILECPEGTVKSRLFYARKVLKEQLQRTAPENDPLPDFA